MATYCQSRFDANSELQTTVLQQPILTATCILSNMQLRFLGSNSQC